MQQSYRWRKPFFVAFLLLLVAVSFLGLYFWQRHDQNMVVPPLPEDERDRVYYKNGWYARRDDLDTILLIGLDQYSTTVSDPDSYINNQQADFLLLMVIDKADKSFFAIHLNRDTMTEIDRLGLAGSRIGSFQGQLALAHTYGSGGRDSCRNTAHAVSRFLYDTPVAHYVSLTMDAIPALNDLVGGVVVHVEDDFSAIDPSIIQGTEQRLHGEQALRFVRARGSVSDESNLNRMKRQRDYMDGLYRQLLLSLNSDESFAARLGMSLADHIVSDLTTDQLVALADRIKDYHFKKIEIIEGEAALGEEFMEFHADEDALKDMVIRLFYEPTD